VGGSHQQQCLHEQRNHYSTPNAAPPPRAGIAAVVLPIAAAGRSPCGCRTASRSPGRSRTQREATRTACKRDSPYAPSPAVLAPRYLGLTVNSMRRFLAMFSSVSLGAIGLVAP